MPCITFIVCCNTNSAGLVWNISSEYCFVWYGLYNMSINHSIAILLLHFYPMSKQKNYFPVGVTVYPKKYAHGFCFAVLCCGYTLTDFPISIRLTSLALWQSNDCPSASKATLMNMDEYFMWIHYERLHNHNKAKHNKTVCIFLGIYCNAQWYFHRVRIEKKKWFLFIWHLSGLIFIIT